MKKSSLAYSVLGIFMAAAFAAQPTLAQQEELERRARELDIMSHIFMTSLNDDRQQRRGNIYQQPKARYLAGQGAVFSFNMAGMRSFMGSRGFNNGDWEQFGLAMSRIGQEVANQVVASFPDLDFDFDFDFDHDEFANPAVPGSVLSPADRDKISQMNEAMREQQRKVQDVQRQIRDVQREQRSSEADLQQLASRLQSMESTLQTQVAALSQQQQAYRDYMEQYQQQAKAQETAANELMMGHILQALCDYGSTLKSLPADEHVTLVFENFQDNKEQIHVFAFRAVAACTSVDDLKQAAVSYLM